LAAKRSIDRLPKRVAGLADVLYAVLDCCCGRLAVRSFNLELFAASVVSHDPFELAEALAASLEGRRREVREADAAL